MLFCWLKGNRRLQGREGKWKEIKEFPPAKDSYGLKKTFHRVHKSLFIAMLWVGLLRLYFGLSKCPKEKRNAAEPSQLETRTNLN